MDKINLVLTVLVFPTIYFVAKHFASSYFNEKGKNLATKEDIGKITEEVKRVESMFSISTSGEIDYNSLKRKAILEYFQSLNTWSALILSSSFKTKEEELGENKLLLDKIKDSFIQFFIKDEAMLLFIHVDEISEISANTSRSLTNLFNNLVQLCNDIDQIYKSNQSDKLNAKKEIENRIKEYYKEMPKYYKIFMDYNDLLIQLLNKHIRSTFNKKEA
ncbi:hypothetical protein [Elizabethkingia anophelis]|uniref:hypothetical protein n=1 Tax=Elizabethkingia anophelis TaxID=1117645 RepID=UPI00378703D6